MRGPSGGRSGAVVGVTLLSVRRSMSPWREKPILCGPRSGALLWKIGQDGVAGPRAFMSRSGSAGLRTAEGDRLMCSAAGDHGNERDR